MKWESWFTKAFRDYRYYFRYKSYSLRRRLLAEYSFTKLGKSRLPLVYVDCKASRVDGVSGRRLHHLVTLFQSIGCPIAIRARIPMIGNFTKQRFKKYLLDSVIVFVKNSQEIDRPYIVLSDYKVNTLPKGCEKWIHLLFDGDFDERSQIALPFPLFPDAYQNGEIDHIEKYRNIPKTKGMIFAGNTYHHYNRKSLTIIYGIIPRIDALNYVKNHLNENEIVEVFNLDQLDENNRNKLVVIESANTKIPQKDWFGHLAKYDFFLCLPGSRYPMCHNAIESLAVGTIPLLEYPEHFYPALQDGVNCIIYRGKEDMVQKIQTALTISTEEKAQLRKGAIEYYETYLSFPKIAESILERKEYFIELHTTFHAVPHLD
jgi:hypothetical protein